MLTRFEVRSARVKGISFHKVRPWVLCGLHNGVIQIWDYRTNTPVDTYKEHQGSVRGVDFHVSQPLFVSGADDYTVKVWNYEFRRCLFTLMGHMDYVRTVTFHLVQPWIVSCSDDYTVRIWNWQSRQCLASLTGHNHYVMCAKFHPTDHRLVVSASLDKTIRLWDISLLQGRQQEAGLAQDMLGTTDVAVLYVMEGHGKGVNWVDFHPTLPQIVSAADDRFVKVWKYDDRSCQELYTLFGHAHNVCCVTFFNNFIISNGEDRTVRVWTESDRGYQLVPITRRETDRYWILATLPENNLIAAGHDTGLQVFKLERERLPYDICGNLLTYAWNANLYEYNFETGELRSNPSYLGEKQPPIAISCDPAGDSVAFVNWEWSTRLCNSRGIGSRRAHSNGSTVFFGPQKFVSLSTEGGETKLIAYSTQNGSAKERTLVIDFTCVRLFRGPMGCVVCKSKDKIYLFQVAQQCSIAEATVPEVKYCMWDKDFQRVAFMSKNAIVIMTKRFKAITTILETGVRMKSAVFDEQRDVLYFTTANHLKYCNLRNSEVSTISTLKHVIYLVRAVGDKIWALSRGGKVLTKELNNVELNFKLKLQQKSYRDVIRIVQRGELTGNALVGYLHKHGHSEIALHFVSDPLTRFNLALECGAMDVAKATATEMNKTPIWRRLAGAATTYGDIQLAQFAAAKAGNLHMGGLLSLITGNMATLNHLITTSKDDSLKLHYGLFARDTENRIHSLAKAGQLPLAYLTAKSSGQEDLCAALLEQMEPDVVERIQQVKYFPPPRDVHVTSAADNWPMLKVEESVFSLTLKEPNRFDDIAEPDLDQLDGGTGWDAEEEDDFMAKGSNTEMNDEGNAAEGGGWEDDIDIDIARSLQANGAGELGGGVVVPQAHSPTSQQWVDRYSVPAFHIAAGSFTSALKLLRRQIGLSDPLPLKHHVMMLWASVNAARPTWSASTAVHPLSNGAPAWEMSATSAPVLPNYLPSLEQSLQAGFQLFGEGKILEAQSMFQSILIRSVLTTVKTVEQLEKLRVLLEEAGEYARALALQAHLRKPEIAPIDSLQLSLYSTHFRLHRPHLVLVLSQAMSKAYKLKNFKTAAAVAQRLLDHLPPKNKAQQAAAIITEAERNPTNCVEINYDERNPFTVCSVSHRPMYRGTVSAIRCSYCHSQSDPSYKGSVCPICAIATVGAESAGLSRLV